MSELVHTNVEALGSLREGVARLVNEAGDVAVAVNQVMRQVQSHAATTLASRQAEVSRLASALDRCRRTPGDPPPNCTPIAVALAAAQRRLADARQAVRITEQTLHAHAAARARLERETQALASQGRNILSAHLGELAIYLAREGTAGGDSTVAASIATRTTAATLGSLAVAHAIDGMPDGYRMVPLNLIDESGSHVHGPEDFTKGYSPEDLTWSYTALREVVLPALARGLGTDHFAELDAQHGFAGSHSYSDCYSGFFSSDEAITLDPRPNGRYHVGNGFHRIWIARGLGLDAVPALVR